MRTIPRALAIVAAIALLTSACGGGGSAPGGSASTKGASPSATQSGPPVRGNADLVIWTDDLKADAVRSVADGFAKQNGISVAVQVIATDLQPNFVTANTAGNGPDVLVGAHDWIGNLVQNGAIDPLQLTPEQLSGYGDVAVRATTYKDKLYGLPFGVEALALYRNLDVVPNAPTTLDDAFAAGEAAQKAGKVESAFNLQQGELGDAYHMEPLYTSMGGVLFGKDAAGNYDPAQLGVGQPGSIAAAKKISELGEGGRKILRRSVSGDNSIALFASGKAAFLVSGPWALRDVKAGGIKYAIQPVPGFAGAAPAKPFSGVQAFFVASKAKNKAFAQEFVTAGVNNAKAMTTLFQGTQLPPAMTSVRTSVAAANPDLEVFGRASEAGDPMPSLPQMSAVWEPLGKAYAAIIGGADPVATMQGAGKTIADAIAK